MSASSDAAAAVEPGIPGNNPGHIGVASINAEAIVGVALVFVAIVFAGWETRALRPDWRDVVLISAQAFWLVMLAGLAIRALFVVRPIPVLTIVGICVARFLWDALGLLCGSSHLG